MTTTKPEEARFYTVGYGGLDSVEDLKQILYEKGIYLIFDVRSNPKSRRFHQTTLEKTFGNNYISIPQMGGLGFEPDQYHEWCDVAAKGIVRVIAAAKKEKVAIMCAEKDPDKCHRKYFVARAVEEQGHKVIHL